MALTTLGRGTAEAICVCAPQLPCSPVEESLAGWWLSAPPFLHPPSGTHSLHLKLTGSAIRGHPEPAGAFEACIAARLLLFVLLLLLYDQPLCVYDI